MSAKTRLRDSAAGLLLRMGVTSPHRRGRRRLSVATFHRVLPEGMRRAYPYPGLVVTPDELDAILAFLNEHFDCGPLAVQHARHVAGEGLARPLLALTFDDAPHDNYHYARPVLARWGMRASFFAPVVAVERGELLWHDRLGFAVLRLVDNPDGQRQLSRVLADAAVSGGGAKSLAENLAQESKALSSDSRERLVRALVQAGGGIGAPAFARPMTFDELADLARDGHEIGSHSMTHRLMPQCDDTTLAYEMRESRRVLEERLARPVESFCYPNGDCDARAARAAAEAGYRRAVTTAWGANERAADPFRLRRFDMDARRVRGARGDMSPELLAFRMSGLYPALR